MHLNILLESKTLLIPPIFRPIYYKKYSFIHLVNGLLCLSVCLSITASLVLVQHIFKVNVCLSVAVCVCLCMYLCKNIFKVSDRCASLEQASSLSHRRNPTTRNIKKLLYYVKHMLCNWQTLRVEIASLPWLLAVWRFLPVYV